MAKIKMGYYYAPTEVDVFSPVVQGELLRIFKEIAALSSHLWYVDVANYLEYKLVTVNGVDYWIPKNLEITEEVLSRHIGVPIELIDFHTSGNQITVVARVE